MSRRFGSAERAVLRAHLRTKGEKFEEELGGRVPRLREAREEVDGERAFSLFCFEFRRGIVAFLSLSLSFSFSRSNLLTHSLFLKRITRTYLRQSDFKDVFEEEHKEKQRKTTTTTIPTIPTIPTTTASRKRPYSVTCRNPGRRLGLAAVLRPCSRRREGQKRRQIIRLPLRQQQLLRLEDRRRRFQNSRPVVRSRNRRKKRKTTRNRSDRHRHPRLKRQVKTIKSS